MTLRTTAGILFRCVVLCHHPRIIIPIKYPIRRLAMMRRFNFETWVYTAFMVVSHFSILPTLLDNASNIFRAYGHYYCIISTFNLELWLYDKKKYILESKKYCSSTLIRLKLRKRFSSSQSNI